MLIIQLDLGLIEILKINQKKAHKRLVDEDFLGAPGWTLIELF